MAIGSEPQPAPQPPLAEPAGPPFAPGGFVAWPLLRHTQISQVVRGRFLPPGKQEQVVLGRGSSLELLRVISRLARDGEEQLVTVVEQPLGSGPGSCAKELAVLRRPGQPSDLLLALSAENQLCVLAFEPGAGRFVSVQAPIHLGSPGFSPERLGALLSAHPRGRAVAVAARRDRLCLLVAAADCGGCGGNVLPAAGVGYPADDWRQTEAQLGWEPPAAAGEGGEGEGWGAIWAAEFVAAEGEPGAAEGRRGPGGGDAAAEAAGAGATPSLLLAVLLARRRGGGAAASSPSGGCWAELQVLRHSPGASSST